MEETHLNGMLLAFEFGYKQAEKGNNLEMALSNFKKTLDPPPQRFDPNGDRIDDHEE